MQPQPIQKKRILNRLTEDSRYVIYDAFRNNKEQIEKCDNYDQVIKLIYGITKVNITSAHVKGFCKRAKINFVHKMKNGSPGGPLAVWIQKFYEYQNATDNELKDLRNQVHNLLERVKYLEQELNVKQH